MKDKLIDEKVVVNIDTPEGRKFYENMERDEFSPSPLEETLKTNEEMKHLSKEMQALLILPKYLLPNANSKVINIISECVLKYEKEHKALEIIKEKQVDVGRIILIINTWFDDDFALHRYNDYLENDLDKWKLTKEEFNLLRDVLL